MGMLVGRGGAHEHLFSPLPSISSCWMSPPRCGNAMCSHDDVHASQLRLFSFRSNGDLLGGVYLSSDKASGWCHGGYEGQGLEHGSLVENSDGDGVCDRKLQELNVLPSNKRATLKDHKLTPKKNIQCDAEVLVAKAQGHARVTCEVSTS